MLSIVTSNGDYLDLSPDTFITIEEYSPMFTDIGSYSMPLSLPPTPGNLAALGYPTRYQRRQRFGKTIGVTIQCGAYVRRASMHIDSAVHNTTISATLYLRESNFNAKIKNKDLKEVFEDVVKTEFKENGHNIGWYSYMNKVMCGDIVTDFCVFPVLLKKESVTEETSGSNTRTWEQFTIANKPNYGRDSQTGEYAGVIATDKNSNPYYMLPYRVPLVDEDGFEYMSPDGYGIAPYLRLTYILRTVFSYFGYSLESSALDTDSSFKSLCIIHPVIDAMVNANINYSQIVPDITVVDFMTMVENSFGLRFVIDERFSTITPRFWKDVLIQKPTFDLSPLAHDWPQISYQGNRALQLTVERANGEAEPMAFDNMQQIIDKYGPFRTTVNNKWDLLSLSYDPTAQSGVYLVADTRSLYAVKIEAGNDPVIDLIDKNVQDFYTLDKDIMLERRELGFSLATLANAPLAGKTVAKYDIAPTKSSMLIKALYEWLSSPMQFEDIDGVVFSMPFIDDVQHANTVMVTETVSSEGTTTSYTEESESSVPVYLAFAHGRAVPTVKYPELAKTFFASQDSYNNIGQKVSTFDLVPYSLYNQFWTQYDKLLETSFHELSGKFNLTLQDVMSLQFDRVYSVDGQSALPLSIHYELSHKGIKISDFTLNIIKEYE